MPLKTFSGRKLPRFIEDCQGELHVEYPDGKGHPYTRPTIQDKWARRLWPAISWLVFFLNFAVVISLITDLWNGEYDNVKHITIVTTICGSYAALKYIHERIAGQNDGRFS